jgi:hypothetical protein
MILAIASVDQADVATHQLKFKRQLEAVVANIAIASDYTITYGDIEPSEVAPRLKEYLNQIAPEDLKHFLTRKLRNYLYTIFSTPESLPKQSSGLQDEGSEDLTKANYANKWSKTKFYQELTSNNHGQGYADPDWLVVEQVNDLWYVSKNDLTLHVQPKYFVEPSAELAPGKRVSLKMPPSLVERGIYIAVGNMGSANKVDCSEDSTINQLYFNIGSGGALCLLSSLTQELNQIKVPFDLRINYDEAEFESLEAMILEFHSSDSELVYSVVKTAYQDYRAYFSSEIPFFSKYLAPGLGFAEKPRLKTIGRTQSPEFPHENLGHHCCGIIALALVEQWQQDSLLESEFNNQSNNRINYVFNYLSEAGVDIEHLYLNPSLDHN